MELFKLVVSDFDGTLIDSDDGIPVTTVAAIDEYRRSSGIFAVATGRVLKSVLEYTKDYFFIDYIVSLNGAYIYDVNKEKVIAKQKLTLKAIRTLNKKYANKNLICYCTPEAWNLYAGPLKEKDRLYDFQKIITNPMSFIDKNKNNIFKMEIHFSTKEEAVKACKEIKKMDLGVEGVVQIHTKKNYVVEITSVKVSKFLGVKKVQELLDIKNKDIAVIGDSYNDLGLMKSSYYKVAVQNACDEIKSKADYLTSSNDNRGVERFLLDKCLKEKK